MNLVALVVIEYNYEIDQMNRTSLLYMRMCFGFMCFNKQRLNI